MLVENWDKIYGNVLYTSDTMYDLCEDSMVIAPTAHTLRLKPINGKGTQYFSIVVTKIENRMVCGIYIDRDFRPTEVFEISKMDLKTIDTFKKLLSYKIANHE